MSIRHSQADLPFRLPFPVQSRPYFELQGSPPICGPYRNLTGTTQFQLQVEAEDETRFKLYDASIIFLLKKAYHDNIPSSYIYTEEFNNKLLPVLVLELLQSCDQKTVHQD